jgi:hypothetical protein
MVTITASSSAPGPALAIRRIPCSSELPVT